MAVETHGNVNRDRVVLEVTPAMRKLLEICNAPFECTCRHAKLTIQSARKLNKARICVMLPWKRKRAIHHFMQYVHSTTNCLLFFRHSRHRFNSTVDNMSNPEIFVVQSGSQALPAYVITFR